MIHPVVFDCMVFLQAATRESSPSGACFKLAESGEINLYTSEQTLEELGDVLNRPMTANNFPQLTLERVAAFLELVRAVSTTITVVPRTLNIIRDPKDAPYLDLAIAVQATYLVSRDSDLLDLMREETEYGRKFRISHPQLIITEPVSFLAKIRSSE